MRPVVTFSYKKSEKHDVCKILCFLSKTETVNDFEGLGMVKIFGFIATRSKNSKNIYEKIKKRAKNQDSGLMVKISQQANGTSKILIFFLVRSLQ